MGLSFKNPSQYCGNLTFSFQPSESESTGFVRSNKVTQLKKRDPNFSNRFHCPDLTGEVSNAISSL